MSPYDYGDEWRQRGAEYLRQKTATYEGFFAPLITLTEYLRMTVDEMNAWMTQGEIPEHVMRACGWHLPPEYTDEIVLTKGVEEGWADPEINPADVTDWPERQARALVPFKVNNGVPENPVEPDYEIREGRGGYGHWGENPCADAFVTACLNGARWVLMVDRADGRGWATPGGFAELGEPVVSNAVRELSEETGLVLCESQGVAGKPSYVHSRRRTAQAWSVTVPVVFDLGEVDMLPVVSAGNDPDKGAKEARWFPAEDYAQLERVTGDRVFKEHVEMLQRLLGSMS